MFAITSHCFFVWQITTNSFQVTCLSVCMLIRLQQRLRRIIDKSLLLLLGTVTSTGHRILKYAMCVGWSHFAQFTIAVVNKDPKKSKYSGILIAPVTLS